MFAKAQFTHLRYANVAERGWAVSRSGILADQVLQYALHSYALGMPTEASLRAAHETVRASFGHCDRRDLEGHAEVPVGAKLAPVLRPDGFPGFRRADFSDRVAALTDSSARIASTYERNES